ncbi:MAG: NAD(P)-dependent oxidoreductase [Armatimonadetes bacterium]|nr:NAD(P)-dependent oxidoreductase [Armatimonadota bacterium]
MRVLLTGGAGNIGRVTLGRLLEAGHEVTVLDAAPLPEGLGTASIVADLTQPFALDALPQPPDAIVHLAAIPNPFVATWDRVLAVNMLATFNVLRYAAEWGVRRVVFGSSESASGWGIHGRFYRPDYLPIDEKHRDLPSEVYSYSKSFGDQLCAGYSREHGLTTLALRYTYVVYEPHYAGFLGGIRAEGRRDARGATYAWIDVRDVAEAIALALVADVPAGSHEAFYLTAHDQYGTVSTGDLARRNWPEDPQVPLDETYYGDEPFRSFFDIRKAEALLGWTPAWDLGRLLHERP